MKIESFVYPSVTLEEPVLLELIKSKPLQRLKRIHVGGYSLLTGSVRESTRYEHSVGVLQLLKLYGADIEEQIAGLLHDVAHTAFSHVSTYAMQEKYEGEEFHEVIKEEFVIRTEIPSIIEKHGFNIERVLDETKFSMLENDAPDICADRIDYSLRDGLIWQFISKDKVDFILDHLIEYQGSFIFNDIKAARYFSDNFFDLNRALYGSAMGAYFNYKFGALLKYAQHKGILEKDFWFKDDYVILDKLKNSKDPKIIETFAALDGSMVVYEDNSNPEFNFSKKIRVVNPQILVGSELKRLADLDKEYKNKIEAYKKNHLNHTIRCSVHKRVSL